MNDNLLDQSRHRNTEQPPMWMVLHYPSEPKRKRWCPQLCADLVDLYGWVMWREDRDVHLKHRCMIEGA